MNKLSKLKLQKLEEVDKYLEEYREEKLRQAQEDIEKQTNSLYKRLDELAELNIDYNKKVKEFDEKIVSFEADTHNLYLKEKLAAEEQNSYKNMVENEREFHRKEMSLLIEAKDQQILFMQEKIKAYMQDLEEYRKESGGEGGKSRQELNAELAHLRQQTAQLNGEIQGKPSDSYITELEEKSKAYDNLTQENKKLTLRCLGLERERHNWQIAVNEITRLTEEKDILEIRLSGRKLLEADAG
jgi:hypothetical protein